MIYSEAPMDLPEIRSTVAQFLNHSDLARAARVCKSWNASFIPSLYSEVHWCPEFKNPLNENIITYADHIQYLHLLMDRFQLLTEHCTKLQVLDISFECQDPEVWDNLSTLVRRNPRIKSLYTRYRRPEPPKAFLEALSTCSRLRKLNVRMDKLDEIRMELILDIAIRLEYLRISCFKIILPKSMDKWSCFPVMEELAFDHTHVPIPLEIFRKCPKLRTLTWRACERTSDSVFDLCDLLRIHCPLIENLTLSSQSLTDMELSLILDSCREVTLLSIYYSMFGEQAFQSLSRHFSKIQKLYFTKCRGLTSAMVQQIMTSYPNLIEFSGGSLDARDLLGIVKDEATGEEKMVTQDWVCTHIQDLAIFINGLEGKPDDWHRRILQQIAKLKKLKILVLSPHSSYNPRPPNDGLNFSLRTGLDSLSSLKQLTVLDISDLRQEMEEQDVRWMLEVWPKLSSVLGILHPNKGRWETLRKILKERKVTNYVYSISENATDVGSGEDAEQEEEEVEEEVKEEVEEDEEEEEEEEEEELVNA
ncbi:hypothetical protein BGZ65_006779 [Modicella reniformis]|uniref:F-box domain-containing protein n=1 Tax=Modicella reniformis TaxID=1440133 RepID=A0A9P6LS43_9FUNG|nr:hypothetical protein BGZ65_006779 [Modicella reniformis]